MDTMLYMAPHEIWSYLGAVSGTVDSTYQAAWLVDGVPGRPVRGSGGSPGGLSLSIAAAAGEVGLVVVGNHNLTVPVTIGGSVSATITPAATRPPNGIQLNPYALISPVVAAATTLTVDVSGNDETEIVGQVAAGKVRTITPVKIDDAQFSHTDFSVPPRLVTLLPFDWGREGRRLKGSQYYIGAELDTIRETWQGQRGGSRLMVLIPDPDLNDAWFVTLLGLSYKPFSKDMDLYLVEFEFQEYPRERW